MSKDNQPANLRLLGSPVNLTNRNKKKDDKKNIRNRPRSALQNSCFTPVIIVDLCTKRQNYLLHYAIE